MFLWGLHGKMFPKRFLILFSGIMAISYTDNGAFSIAYNKGLLEIIMNVLELELGCSHSIFHFKPLISLSVHRLDMFAESIHWNGLQTVPH